MILYSKTYNMSAEELRYDFKTSSGLLIFLKKETIKEAVVDYSYLSDYRNRSWSTYSIEMDTELDTCKITLKCVDP